MNVSTDDMSAKTGPCRVEKVRDLFNTPTVNHTGKYGVCTSPPVEKVDDSFNKHEIFAVVRQERLPTGHLSTQGCVDYQMTIYGFNR